MHFTLKGIAVVSLFTASAALLISSGEAQVSTPSESPRISHPEPTPNVAEDFSLILGEARFDLRNGAPAANLIPLQWQLRGDDQPLGVATENDDLHLVQFTGPTRQQWLDQLNDAGMKIIQYIHPYTYIVWGSEINRTALADQVQAVRATGPFVPGYKVLPQWRALPNDLIEVAILAVRSADIPAIIDQLSDQNGPIAARVTGNTSLNDVFEHITIEVRGSTFLDIARIPGVYTVQPVPTDGGTRGELSNQLNVGNYNGANQAFPGYMTYLNSVGLSGAGVIIANVDSGIQDTHPNLANRLLPCVGSTCGNTASSNHGTHTAGIMAADNSNNTLDPAGFARGMGVAPGANLVEQLYSPTFTQAGGMLTLMRQSYANGALLSGNSWGPSGSPLGYDNNTMQTDIGVRDTDSTIAGDQHLTYVLSIMNGNGGTGTQGTPDDGKNLFTIGSTKGQNTNLTQILDIDDVSANSAHGPARDGRKIPHMVAPGCNIDSTTTTSSHGTLCGTSMASPHVSGAVALFIEKYRSLPDYESDPSPALVKAAFLPVAYDLAGNLDADGGLLGHPFDSKQGWGRMNLDAVINTVDNGVQYYDQLHVFDNTGEEWVENLSPLDGGSPMRIMLVWTDAPGHGLAGATPAWNNNLDLIVETGNGTYRGNVFGANGYSMTGGVADDRNNTEGVFLPAGEGPVTIRVVAANINSNGLPNSGDATDQDFALVVYNAASEPGFALGTTPRLHEVCAPTNVSYTVNVSSILEYVEPVTLSVNLPSGVSGGFTPNPVVPGNASTLDLTIEGDAIEGVHALQIVGTSVDLERTSNVSLKISNVIPAAVTLLSPANGSLNVSAAPALSWSAAAQAESYEVQIALDAGFANVMYSDTSTSNAHNVTSPLATDTIHYWRVRASNICGTGLWSSAFSFRTLDVPPILLVDDDDNGPNVRQYYTAALDSLGVFYDIWDVNNNVNPEPTFNQMSPYKIIIWFSGDGFGGTPQPKAGPTAASELALSQWLDGGGCLFLSSQDYCYDRLGGTSGTTANSFMQNYLGLATIAHDQGYTAINAGVNVFAGYGPWTLTFASGSGGPGMSNFVDRFVPNAGGLQAFSTSAGAGGPTAITRDGAIYRSSFWGFPFETIPSAQSRIDVMAKIISWCGELNPEVPCDGDIAPEGGDGSVGVPDLLMVINQWSASCGGCTADIAPPGGDGAVGVPDLLAIINSWGACPE